MFDLVRPPVAFQLAPIIGAYNPLGRNAKQAGKISVTDGLLQHPNRPFLVIAHDVPDALKVLFKGLEEIAGRGNFFVDVSVFWRDFVCQLLQTFGGCGVYVFCQFEQFARHGFGSHESLTVREIVGPVAKCPHVECVASKYQL